MTPYTKTLIGHLTSVEAGALSARLVEDNEGRLPRISVPKDSDMSGQPGSYVAIIQGDIKLLAIVTSITEVPSSHGSGTSRIITLIPAGEVTPGGVFRNGIKNYPVTGAEEIGRAHV